MPQMNRIVLAALLFTGGLNLSQGSRQALAEEQIVSAESLVSQLDRIYQPSNNIQDLTMVSTSKSGKEKIRQSQVKTRIDGDITSTLLEVTSPQDISGTKFLAIQGPNKIPETYLYLPKLGRTTQVKAKRAGLMGSDFSPAELDFSQWKNASHELNGSELLSINGVEVDCHIMESTISGDADYAKRKSWVSKAELFPRQVEFMEKDDKVVKRWVVTEVGQEGSQLYPKVSTMFNLQKGSKTEMIINSAQFAVEAEQLPAEAFTPAGLPGPKAESETKGQ